MNSAKIRILSGLYNLKVFDIIRHFQKKRVIILMYHRFSSKREPFKIQQSVFENQIRFLIKKKYNFIRLQHYSEVLNNRRDDLPDNSVIVTIDDGYMDNFTYAYPILRRYTIPATIFLVTDFIDKKFWLWPNKLEFILKRSKLKSFEFPLENKTDQFLVDNFQNWHKTQLSIFDYCRMLKDDKKNAFLDELAKHLKVDVPEQTVSDFQPLTWDQIIEMGKRKIEFGSHTCSHPILSKISSKEVEHELLNSKKQIESQLDAEVTSFCYPNGQPEDINNTILNLVKTAGYHCAVSTVKGFNTSRSERFFLNRTSFASDNRITLAKELVLLK